MTVATPPPTESAPRRRDAAGTRQLLLSAARRRFARAGYTTTTLREIADDAGVNVALIGRYFASKEGLFEACLRGAASDLDRSVAPDATLDQIAETIAQQITGPYTAEHPNRLLLLIRTSGDERAEKIRVETLQSFTERLVEVVGGRPDGPGHDRLVLGAQLALGAAFGIAVLRTSTALEPLASADEADLVAPVRDLVRGFLTPPDPGRG